MKTICAIAAIGVLGMLRPAAADDEIVRGQVLKVEASEIYVNLGKSKDVTAGAPIRIKRTIRLVHPVTRAPVVDWVPIGSAVITQAGEQLSRAVVGKLIDDIKVGDVAEVLIDRPDTKTAPRPPPTREPQGPVIDPATAAVLTAFAAQTGQSIDARIATWENFLSKHPRSPYAAAIRKDVDLLTTLREQMRPRTAAGADEVVATVEHNGPASARAGEPIPMVFVLDHPERVAAAYLHYRETDAHTYRRVLLTREHDIYLRGAIPAEATKPPGVDYFVEVSSPAGAAGLAIGTPTQPLHVDVIAPSPITDRFGPAVGRSSVKLAGEYLDFGLLDPRAGDRTDHVAHATVDFVYRIDRLVQSIGVGYGVLSGRGGFANREYSDADPIPTSAFQFGYADLELALNKEVVPVSAGGKLIAGVGREGFGMGAEGRLRIGSRDAANLMFVASTLQQVGFLADIRFGARPVSDLGFVVSVGATDQPNNGDIGVTLGTELEYFASTHFSLLLRGSWQGRTTEHSGVGGGAGVGFSW